MTKTMGSVFHSHIDVWSFFLNIFLFLSRSDHKKPQKVQIKIFLYTSCIFFSCCCRACRENWPLFEELADFTPAEAEARPEWVVERLALEAAADRLDLAGVEAACHQLARLTSTLHRPHAALVAPESYLALVIMLLKGNRSIQFCQWLKKMQANT
jgi:hypothetical protein